MKIFKKVVVLFTLIIFANCQVVFSANVEDHAPIGVMWDHMHKIGDVMVSYRYGQMDMPNNFSGKRELTTSQVHEDFMIAPISMSIEKHMFDVMYGVTDSFSIMAMLPYVIKDMENRRRSDAKKFGTQAQGLGDITLSGLYSVKKLIKIPVHLNLGISLPSGSIDKIDHTLSGDNQNLPYPMQLGSGTYDWRPGITYFDKSGNLSWGLQGLSIIRTGKNDHDYRLGNQYDVTTWVGYTWSKNVSTSLRIKGSQWNNIVGADNRINVNAPTADPSLQGGERLDLLVGINFLGQTGRLSGHRIALEIGYPIYQELDGPQLGAGLQGTIGWQLSW